MGERKIICSLCKEKFNKSELTYVTKSKKYCSKCYEKATKDTKDYKSLIDYICKGFNLKSPTGHQLKSIKKFKEMGYEYSEIAYVIYYIFSVKKINPENNSLELVSYYYEEAKKHYNDCQRLKKSFKKINRNVRKINRNFINKDNKNKTKYIDFNKGEL